MMPNNLSKGFHHDPAISPCLFDKRVYDVYCIIPAVIIITILAFLNKRVRIKPKTCGGRPGLVLPCCFVRDSNRNRLCFAVAFGIMGQSCYKLFADVIGSRFLSLSGDSVIKIGRGSWGKELTLIVWVLLYGVINFPIFACLMTDHLLVGTVFGFLHTLMKFIVSLALIFSCPSYTIGRFVTKTGMSRAYEESVLYMTLPDLLCHLLLLVHFLLTMIKVLRRKFRGTPAEDLTHAVAKGHDYIHVNLLLSNKLNESSITPCKWYIRLRDKIYKPRPDFKFSSGIFSTLTVAVIFIYQMTVSWIILMSYISKSVMFLRLALAHAKIRTLKGYLFKAFVDAYDEIEVFLYFSVCFNSALSVLLMLHFMKCHRDHVLISYKTKRHLGNSPSRLVIRSLSYPGYQIAYIGLGFNFVFAILFVVLLVFGLLVNYLTGASFWTFIQEILPLFVVSLCVRIVQYLMGRLVFRDRRYPDTTININNHRLYCVVSFFFFFFNILVGYVSSMLRMARTAFLQCLFLPRIDQTPLMLGYHKWDQGYMSYIGFLNVLKSHNHPVMLVFCQLLVDLQRSRNPQSLGSVQEYRQFYRLSKTAFSRWLVAYTLIKNPELQKFRKRFLRVSFLTDLEASSDVSSMSFLV